MKFYLKELAKNSYNTSKFIMNVLKTPPNPNPNPKLNSNPNNTPPLTLTQPLLPSLDLPQKYT